MLKITTETGSYYEFDEDRGIVVKNGSHAFKYGIVQATPNWGPAVRESAAKGASLFAHEWVTEHGEDRFPVVGECLYVVGFDAWYLSTPVVSVEEI